MPEFFKNAAKWIALPAPRLRRGWVLVSQTAADEAMWADAESGFSYPRRGCGQFMPHDGCGDQSIMGFRMRPSRNKPFAASRAIVGRLAVLALLPMVGCTAVPAYKQQQLAKPNMVFDDTQAFAFSARLLPQCEPGTAVNGSSPGGGCTACR